MQHTSTLLAVLTRSRVRWPTAARTEGMAPRLRVAQRRGAAHGVAPCSGAWYHARPWRRAKSRGTAHSRGTATFGAWYHAGARYHARKHGTGRFTASPKTVVSYHVYLVMKAAAGGRPGVYLSDEDGKHPKR